MNALRPLVHFRGEDRLNCAQAVLKTFAQVVGTDAACIERFASFGGGRAPGGECGALAAAKAIVASPAAQQHITDRFLAAAGSIQCRAIRRLGQLSCHECVQLAADEVYAGMEAGQRLRRPRLCSQCAS